MVMVCGERFRRFFDVMDKLAQLKIKINQDTIGGIVVYTSLEIPTMMIRLLMIGHCCSISLQ